MRTHAALMLAALLTAAAGVMAQTEPEIVKTVHWSEPPMQARVPVDLSVRKQMAIPELPAAPQIDGDLSDPAWESAAQTDPWMINTGEAPAPVQTTAWLGIRSGTLFVGVRADEPNVAGIVTSVTEDGGPAWNDDCIELFIDGNLDLTTSRQLVINAGGSVTLIDHGGGAWNTQVARAVSIGDDAWFAEFSLPLSSLGLTGTDFGLNICRERRAGGGTELSCWSPTGGGFQQPGKFGVAGLPGGWLRGFVLGTGLLGSNELAVAIQNPEQQPRSLRVRLTWWQGEGIALERTVGPFTLEPGASREVSIAYTIERADAPVELELAVLDEQGRALATYEVVQSVERVLDARAGRSVLVVGETRMFARALLSLNDDALARSRLVVALFRQPSLSLVARSEFTPPRGRAMRVELALPPLEPGEYSLHVVLKTGEGDAARRIAEEKSILHVLAPVQ